VNAIKFSLAEIYFFSHHSTGLSEAEFPVKCQH
jgi:hypothetical protein